jgi:hypothetical protein
MDQLGAVVATAHLLATVSMVGLIWFVQVVHYPLFAAVGPDGFAAYETAHTRRTGWVVGPFMGVEGACAVLLAVAPPPGVDRGLAVVGLALLGVVHASTVGLQVPAHQRLCAGFDEATWHRLVRTNWIRTVGWSARGVVALAIAAMATT